MCIYIYIYIKSPSLPIDSEDSFHQQTKHRWERIQGCQKHEQRAQLQTHFGALKKKKKIQELERPQKGDQGMSWANVTVEVCSVCQVRKSSFLIHGSCIKHLQER